MRIKLAQLSRLQLKLTPKSNKTNECLKHLRELFREVPDI